MAQTWQASTCPPEVQRPRHEHSPNTEADTVPGCTEGAVVVLHKVGEYLWSQLTSHLGLFLLLMLYTVTGGGIMYGVEQYFSGDTEACKNLTDTAAAVSGDFHEYFINRTMKAAIHENATEISPAQLHRILMSYDREKRRHERCREIPDYWDWVLFCLTVYTTIGYGSIHPKSRPGRIATMFYATIGVPLFLLTMGKLGKLATRKLKYLLSKIRKLFYKPHLEFLRKNNIVQKLKGKSLTDPSQSAQITMTTMRQVSMQTSQAQSLHGPSHQTSRPDTMAGDNSSYVSYNIDDEFNLHPLIAIIITLLYILFGCFMYMLWEEDWAYYDAFYFIFISISTIGLGDVVPQHPKFFLLSSIYILLGLALVAMVIDVLIEFFTKTYEVVAEALPEILHSEDDSMSGKDVGLQAGLKNLVVPFQQHRPIGVGPSYHSTSIH